MLLEQTFQQFGGGNAVKPAGEVKGKEARQNHILLVLKSGEFRFQFRRVISGKEVPVYLYAFDDALFHLQEKLHSTGGSADCLAEIVGGGSAEIPVPGAVFLAYQIVDKGRLVAGEFIVLRLGIERVHMVSDTGDKFLHFHGLGQVLADVGDPGGNGLYRFVVKLEGIGFECLGKVCHTALEEDGAVLEHLFLPDELGITAEFLAVQDEVIAPFQTGIQTQFTQDLQNGAGVGLEIVRPLIACVHDEAEIEVAEVVKDGSASRHAPHHFDVVFLHEIIIDFGQGVLVLADDDGRGVDIEVEAVCLLVL